MQTKKFQNKQDWLEARKCKITGSKLKGVIKSRHRASCPWSSKEQDFSKPCSCPKKKGFYELVADRLAKPATDENPMNRGNRLEEEAMRLFSDKTGKEVDMDRIIWERDEDTSIAISPDGVIGDTEAVEVKCLNSANHIEALLTQEVPRDYRYQILQYFIVNDKLEKLYFVFYDPRLTVQDFFHFTLNREDYEDDIAKYLLYQRHEIEQVNNAVEELLKGTELEF